MLKEIINEIKKSKITKAVINKNIKEIVKKYSYLDIDFDGKKLPKIIAKGAQNKDKACFVKITGIWPDDQISVKFCYPWSKGKNYSLETQEDFENFLKTFEEYLKLITPEMANSIKKIEFNDSKEVLNYIKKELDRKLPFKYSVVNDEYGSDFSILYRVKIESTKNNFGDKIVFQKYERSKKLIPEIISFFEAVWDSKNFEYGTYDCQGKEFSNMEKVDDKCFALQNKKEIDKIIDNIVGLLKKISDERGYIKK